MVTYSIIHSSIAIIFFGNRMFYTITLSSPNPPPNFDQTFAPTKVDRIPLIVIYNHQKHTTTKLILTTIPFHL